MLKYRKAIYGLLAAFAFYAFFGFFIPVTFGLPEAAESISPVMRAIVVLITLGLVVQSFVYFLRANKK